MNSRGGVRCCCHGELGGLHWGCISEDPKESFGEDIFREVRRSLFETWLLRARVLFDVATGEERPASRVW